MYALNVARYQRFPDVKLKGMHALPKICVLTSEKVVHRTVQLQIYIYILLSFDFCYIFSLWVFSFYFALSFISINQCKLQTSHFKIKGVFDWWEQKFPKFEYSFSKNRKKTYQLYVICKKCNNMLQVSA